MVAPSRYTAMIATVNSSFLRRSGVRNALAKADSNFFLLREVTAGSGGSSGRRSVATDTPSWERTLTVSNGSGQARSPVVYRPGTKGYRAETLERGAARAAARANTPDFSQFGGCPTGGHDLLPGRFAE